MEAGSLTGTPLVSHYTPPTGDGTCLAPSWAAPRKGQRPPGRPGHYALSPSVLRPLIDDVQGDEDQG